MQQQFSTSGIRLTTQKCCSNKSITLMLSKQGSTSQCNMSPRRPWRFTRNCLALSSLRSRTLRLGKMMFYSMRPEIQNLIRCLDTSILISMLEIRRGDMPQCQVFCKEPKLRGRSIFQLYLWWPILGSLRVKSHPFWPMKMWQPFSMSLATSCTTCAQRQITPDSLERVSRETSWSSQVKCSRTGCGINLLFKKFLSITRQENSSLMTC